MAPADLGASASAGSLLGRTTSSGRPASSQAFSATICSDMDTGLLRGALTGRLKSTLRGDPGFASRPKSRDLLIAQKVKDRSECLRPQERKYWSWARKLDAEGDSVFKMPRDPLAGLESFDERARLHVKDLKAKTLSTMSEHQRWLEKVTSARNDEGERRAAHEAQVAKDRAEAATRRAAELEESKRLEDERAAEYLAWAGESKPSALNLPQPQPGAQREAREQRKAKVKAFADDNRARWAEYSSWVKSVSKPSGCFPKEDRTCLSPEQREAAIKEMALNKYKKLKTSQADYDRWMSVVKEKSHERMVNTIEERKKWSEEVSGNPDERIADRKAQLLREQEQAVHDHNEFVRSLHAKARSMPLLVEDSQFPASFVKRYNHRSPVRRRPLYIPGEEAF
eukprot:TRINITY_DN22951_c0_g1_i2.p1 TRINITY_DN22951_c0_g1~~TRINITY_DN22951_c0_g1_i2.p1  ORF type:complete len:427 (-),score=103.01 TRINITY_DN22951_c0_g1_i2:34-1224(-)